MSIIIRVSAKFEYDAKQPTNLTTINRIKVIKRDTIVPNIIETNDVPVKKSLGEIRDNWIASKNATQNAELSQMRAFLFGGTN